LQPQKAKVAETDVKAKKEEAAVNGKQKAKQTGVN